MVETMYEQSPALKKLKEFQMFYSEQWTIWKLPLSTNFAFATQISQNESCAQLFDNDRPHIHSLIEVTKDFVNVVNKMTSTTFVVPGSNI